MRVLFVSGTSVGGAARSTHELAALLARRGHTVGVVVRDETAPLRTYVHRRAVNLRVKREGRPGAAAADTLARRIGRRLEVDARDAGYQSWTAVRPENALAGAVASVQPDVVVVNSIDLPAWRQLLGDLRARGMPVVLYIREENGLLHLSHSKLPPDRLFANASGHVDAARALGFDALLVPSIVDCSTCRTTSSRERVVFVNPVAMYGVDVALGLARARPDVPFAFVESWPLDRRALGALQAELAALPNVELRRFVPDPRAVFRDARVLLAPYRYPGRSRILTEAQCNGVPALASDRYGLAEAVGDAGLLVDPDGPLDAWVAALGALWDDADAYAHYADAALAASNRPEIQPDAIATSVEHALDELVAAHAAGHAET